VIKRTPVANLHSKWLVVGSDNFAAADLYIPVYTNPRQHAWQAGVHLSKDHLSGCLIIS
jgi:hypothetical protein